MARQPRGRLVQRLLTPRRHLLPQGFFCQVYLLVRIALLGQLERHEPVHVRVGEVEDQLALLALATPFPGLNPGPFPGSFTDERLREPEPQALLPDTGWALKQEGLWQPAGGNRAYQPVSDPLMAVQGGDWHGGNVSVVGFQASVRKRKVLRQSHLRDFF